MLISVLFVPIVFFNIRHLMSQKESVVGLCVHGLSDDDLEAVQELGVRWIRADVEGQGWSEVIEKAPNNNLHVVGILDHQTMGFSDFFTLEDWTLKVEESVRNYKSFVDAWEIWNEPQFTEFQYGFMDGSPEHYFLMLQSSYEIIKTLDKDATVIGLGGTNIYGNTLASDFAFATEVMRLGGGQYLDAISLHMYKTFGDLPTSSLSVALPFYRGFDKEIWITEYGESVEGGDQRYFLVKSKDVFDTWKITKHFCYILRDDNQYGLLSEDGERLDSFYAFKELYG